MIVYFDVSCLNRPYDDQSQARIRMESEAVLLLLERCLTGGWKQVSSTVALAEISRIIDLQRRDRVEALLPGEADLGQSGGYPGRKPHMKLTMEEIRTAGLQALKERLGPVGMARFLQQFEHGSGDYSRERHAWVDRTSMPELLRQMKSAKARRKTAGKH